jgi:hypothetical protein
LGSTYLYTMPAPGCFQVQQGVVIKVGRFNGLVTDVQKGGRRCSRRTGRKQKGWAKTAIGYGLDVTQMGGECHVYAGRGVDTEVRVGRG